MATKSFLVLAMLGDKFVGAPMLIAAKDREASLRMGAEDLASRIDNIDHGTMLHSFAIDSDVIYIGRLDPEEKPEDQQGEGSEQQDAMCACPNAEGCRFVLENGMCDKKLCSDDSQEVVKKQSRSSKGAVEQPPMRAAKPCTDPGERDDLTVARQEYVYGPRELLFAIGPYAKEGGRMIKAPGIEFVVYFTTKECWDTNRCQSDDLGGHNISEDALRAAGIHTAELMEGVFEVLPRPGDTEQALVGRLIDADFEYSADFQTFITEMSEG